MLSITLRYIRRRTFKLSSSNSRTYIHELASSTTPKLYTLRLHHSVPYTCIQFESVYMAKVHPHLLSSPSSSSSSEETEKFTVWMKSLVLNGNGCTIYDATGNVVYRIDNYDTKCSSQVFLMDLKGKVLSTIIRKKLRINEHWDGYKNDRAKSEKPWFQVKKVTKALNKKGDGFSCQVTIEGDESQAFSCFRIQGCSQKSEFKIIRGDGLVVAQVKRKQSTSGVMLGDDVLSLEVEPNTDHSFIISLVVVHGLISHKI